MKKNKYSIMTVALLVATSFTSCNINDEIQDNAAVRFTATVGKASAVTKAAGTTWEAGDVIGIFMVNTGTNTIAEGADNRQYATTGDGTFTAVNPDDEIYYPMNGSAVDFIAYYPLAGNRDLTTPVSVGIAHSQDESTQSLSDLLWARENGNGGYSKASTDAVALRFEHKLSKIVLNIVQPSSLSPNNTGLTDSNLTDMEVSIKGMNSENTFDLTSGTLGTPKTVVTITPRTIVNGKAYDAIIMPGDYASGAITVEFWLTTGEVFTWNAGTETFEGGNEYTYAVTLRRTGVVVTSNIAPWKGVDRGGVVAE